VGWTEPQVIREIESGDSLAQLRSGKAHCRSLGCARDDKGERGVHLSIGYEGWTGPQVIRETQSGHSLAQSHNRSLGFFLMTKRRVECCGIPLKPKPGLNGAPSLRCSGEPADGVVTLHLTPEAAVEGAVLDGFCNVAHGDLWPCVKIGDGAGDFQYPVVGARAQALLLHGAFEQPLRLR
jgi:hypothetical protein